MAFDKRGYFYRNVRANGKVRREFYGRGVFAELAAFLLEEDRLQRAKAAQAKKAHSMNLTAADGLLRALDS